MKLSIGKLSTGLLFLTMTAGSAWAQIPNVVQHVQDQMNDVQQQKKAAGDAALNGNAPAKVSAGKPAAATAAKPTAAAPAIKPVATKSAQAPTKSVAASSKPATTAAQKSTASSASPKPSVAQTKPTAAPGSASAKAGAAAKTPAPVAVAAPAKKDPFVKGVAAKTTSKPTLTTAAVAKKQETKTGPTKSDAKTTAAKAPDASPADSSTESKEDAAERKKESGYATAGNRRDPFVSPIVQHMGGSGCSTGKRCLAIDQIALRGIVKSDGGMIAVVVNSLDKAYFLRENDPVFNGYVLKISGDSVVFKETVQDKLGHLSTREVVKKITTPAV